MASVKKNANGTYRVRACLGRDKRTGKQIWRTATFQLPDALTPAREKREITRRADEWERQQREDYEAGLDRHRDKVTLAAFVRGSWWTYTEGRGLAPNTIISWKKLAATITEFFGERIRIVEINREQIDKFLGWLRNEKKYSDATVRMNFDALRNVLDYATACGYLKENPIDRMKVADRPHRTIQEPDFLSQDEARAFLEALDGDKRLSELWRAYFQLLIFAGLRRSEGLALTWADYDTDKRELLISKALTLTGDAEAPVAIKDTKTGKARRVPVSDTLAEALERRRQEMIAQYDQCDPHWYIFGRTEHPDRPQHPSVPWRKLTAFQKRHGLRRTSIHLLRHSFASLALQNGADLKTIQRTLGHSRPGMTLMFYSGVSEKQQRAAVESVEKALNVKKF